MRTLHVFFVIVFVLGTVIERQVVRAQRDDSFYRLIDTASHYAADDAAARDDSKVSSFAALRAMAQTSVPSSLMIFDAIVFKAQILLQSGTDVTVQGAHKRQDLVGGPTTRLFEIQADANLTLAHVSIIGGIAPQKKCSSASIFGDEICSPAGGGVVYVHSHGSLTMRECSVRGSRATDGGAIFLEPGAVLVAEHSRFLSLSAAGGAGGAIWAMNARVTLEWCTFSGNTCDSHGGALYAHESVVELRGTTFHNNSASFEGGALVVNAATLASPYPSETRLTISGCTFTENTVCLVRRFASRSRRESSSSSRPRDLGRE